MIAVICLRLRAHLATQPTRSQPPTPLARLVLMWMAQQLQRLELQFLAAASIGDVVVAALDLSNVTADSLLNVSSVTVSGDGSFDAPGGLGFLPIILDDATSNNQWSVLMDTATAGAPKSATVTIVSDDVASPYVDNN